MSKMLTPMELYHAARETCIRLYVANGGAADAEWRIQPYPGTAAISCRKRYMQPDQWTLCMPALPLDIRLPRWKADLIGAYTVHELLHALWTDWDVTKIARGEGLHSLCNALEDNRIEWKASRGALVMVSEARRLLVALNDHIARRAFATVGFKLDDPKQFSFVLNLVLFAEKLGYVSPLPAEWRKLVRPEWLPLFDLALVRFEALASTMDVLVLARDLKALAASLPKPAKPQGPVHTNPAKGEDGEGEGPHETPPNPLPVAPRDAEIVEPEDDGGDASLDDLTGTDKGEELAPGIDDAEKPEGGQEASEPIPPTPGLEWPPTSPGDNPESVPETAEGEMTAGDAGGRGGALSEPEEPAEDVTDATQEYEEANLNDVAAEAAKDAGKSESQVLTEAAHASTILNVPLPTDYDPAKMKGGSPNLASASIESPAKLRRDLTNAVKSPERVATERRQVSGRLDMRNVVGLATGASNVFKRRVEEEGREAAVSILIDVSGSMAGARLAAAKAMCIHMGDALKAAGVRFEVSGFDDSWLVRPKAFSEGWAEPTRRRVAGMKTLNGTCMLPAMKACAERLAKVPNVSRRILLVLTDGQDTYAPDANAALCAFYAGRGVEIVGIGLMTHSIKEPFRGKACEVWRTRDLSRDGLKMLVKVLDAGAARSA